MFQGKWKAYILDEASKQIRRLAYFPIFDKARDEQLEDRETNYEDRSSLPSNKVKEYQMFYYE